jgi:hypothetical protein
MENCHALLVDLRRLPERRAVGAMANERLPGGRRITWATRVTMPATPSPALSAYDHGYNVTLVVDAMTDLHADAHRHSVEKIFPRLGELATTDDMVFRYHRVPLFVMQRIAPSAHHDAVPAFARTERICATTAAPSPIAPPTRLTEPDRTSPTANTPSRFDSNGSGLLEALSDDALCRGTSDPV